MQDFDTCDPLEQCTEVNVSVNHLSFTCSEIKPGFDLLLFFLLIEDNYRKII